MYRQLNPPQRILMGPGPSEAHPRVYAALAAPIVGHLDPEFLTIMEETKDLLRYVFRTKNPVTLPVSGTGGAGMEACLTNLLEPGDKAVVCIHGFFGTRMREIAERCGATPIAVEAPWGRPIDPADVERAVKESGAKLVAIVHAETSTGVLQPLGDICRVAKAHGALVVLDTVTSLGGCDVRIDDWGIDAAYSGTQKCLGGPPGLSPVTFNDRAMEVAQKRRTKVRSWYLDMALIAQYWGESHTYHHTAPVSLNYALREALLLVQEEGLEDRVARHRKNHLALVAGLEAMGLEMFVEKAHCLPSLNTVKVPDGVDEAKARRRLLDRFSLEIGAGLGPLRGKIWRIGLMGYASSARNVATCLTALEDALRAQGHRVPEGAGVKAALALL
ncbi:MAG: alanine--glyoxylate aminotransferase [Candidatus Handelsmanbacteria bacterium RIFCSPLOWO2_12_FULL_64_10]|uniref:Alanine--glyoxylate aminotransferase n=1 Tax=Handelsmanbacteria sp. (strain RIFCSPLOWO2_12_FULL_64_10) TaxID=1817868 RepID=A0A1F6C3C3_HANXR|nr:MAG: alanine--glyoxylate aminotransferase [Candidatus Handelsmanbacteria bacterium RIFCSPLOWO2_12_FULL_64_10]